MVLTWLPSPPGILKIAGGDQAANSLHRYFSPPTRILPTPYSCPSPHGDVGGVITRQKCQAFVIIEIA